MKGDIGSNAWFPQARVAFQEKVERRGEGEEVGCVSCGFWDLVVCLGLGAVNVIIVFELRDYGLGEVVGVRVSEGER